MATHSNLATECQALESKNTKLLAYFKSLPSLYLSEKGIQNISKKFGLSTIQVENILNKLINEQANKPTCKLKLINCDGVICKNHIVCDGGALKWII